MKHWYETCIGDIFQTDKILSFEELYCGICGDYHYYIGMYETEEEAIKALEESECLIEKY